MKITSSDAYKMKAADFHMQSLQGRDSTCLFTLVNQHKAKQAEPDASYYLVFEQGAPCFYSLQKQRIKISQLADIQTVDSCCQSIKAIASDSAVAEIEVDFPLAIYRAGNRYDSFNFLLSLKEKCGHSTLNLRIAVSDIASEYELNDIAKLCIVAGADNLTLVFDQLTVQEEAYITLISKLLQSLYVADSCGLVFAGLKDQKLTDRVVRLAKSVLGQAWIDNKYLKFEC